MSTRPGWRGFAVAIVALLVAACSTKPAPTVVPVDLTPEPSAIAGSTFAPSPTSDPSVDPNALPPTTSIGWWGDPDFYDGCRIVGHYRIGYRVAQIGNCTGMTAPPELTLDVGQDFDLHMSVPADGAQPTHPLPEAEDPLIVRGWLAFDDATWTYRALSPGTTRLVSAASCDERLLASPGPAASCAVLVIHVRDISTKCIDLEAALCRAAGAAAVGSSGAMPGQRIVGWVAAPSSSKIEWPGCGKVVAKVTVELRDPGAQSEVTLGQLEPDVNPLALAVCTY
ncbi:MAG TPA: hypothetical protein VJ850_00220 [Candidatus Limnocylindrales bacterium]|nr:hypothetical protein [Candidatus Limnocylindrales bacterium]